MEFDQNTIKAIIGFLGVACGGVIGGAVAAYNARQKLKELEVSHSHQLHASYMKNAREYLESVYIPISVDLIKLSQAYYSYRTSTALGGVCGKSDFVKSAALYSESINALLVRGAGAFLTTELESKLLQFGSFVGESLMAGEVVRRVVVQYGISLFGTGTYVMRDFKVNGKAAKFWQGSFGFSQLGISIKMNGEMILAAPLSSKEFDEYFSYYTSILSLLIKEVTLGSVPRSKV